MSVSTYAGSYHVVLCVGPPPPPIRGGAGDPPPSCAWALLGNSGADWLQQWLLAQLRHLLALLRQHAHTPHLLPTGAQTLVVLQIDGWQVEVRQQLARFRRASGAHAYIIALLRVDSSLLQSGVSFCATAV
jgi:hypothetical protein